MRIRRPLFWAALFLVIIAAVQLETGGFQTAQSGTVSAQSLGSFRELVVIGQVYKKDGQTLYLQDVSVHLQSSEGSEDPLSEVVSRAGTSRQSISCKDNIICKLEEAEGVPLGSYVTLQGSFAPIAPATNPGEFDAAAYYQTMGVGGRLSQCVLLEQGGSFWPLRQWLYELRQWLEERLYRALPERNAGVLCALLLGDKEGLEDQVEDLYRRSGILHILSISSLHITILGMSLYSLLRRLRVPVGPAAFMGSVLLLLYGALTGFGVSACRAIGMYLIRMLGEVLGRTYDMLTGLGFVGAVMVWANPYYLYHSGFLLSFSSVLGVGVLCPVIVGEKQSEDRCGVGDFREAGVVRRFAAGFLEKLRQSAAASLSVVLATLPVQLWCYYEVPVYSVFLNLLVLPLVKPLMLLGAIVMLFPGFGVAGMAAGLILQWYEWLCGLCGRLPFHTWNPGCPRHWQIAVYYLLLGAVILFLGRRKDMGRRQGDMSWRRNRDGARAIRIIWRRMTNVDTGDGSSRREQGRRLRQLKGECVCRAVMGAVSVCAVLLLGLRPAAENRAIFLDVGQGDCILVQTASGENYLFDCGSTSRTGVGEYVLLPFLKYSGIHTLDAVFVSHPDKDHVSGILELLEMGGENGVEVQQMVLPGFDISLRQELLGELIQAARGAGQSRPIDLRYISAGDMWQCGSARFTCLHPGADFCTEDTNAGSECFLVEFLDDENMRTLLLTGDVEGEGEEALLAQLAILEVGQIDVLKVAHHGSRGATSEALLALTKPRLAVISCGRSNSYGHPHPELLERLGQAGCTVLQTTEYGAVTLRFREEGIRAEAFRAGA